MVSVSALAISASFDRACKLAAAICGMVAATTALAQLRDTVYHDSIAYRTRVIAANPVSLIAEGGYDKHVVSEGILPQALASGCDTFQVASSSGVAFSAGFSVPLDNTFYLLPTLTYRDLSSRHTYGEFFTDTIRTGNDSLIRTSVPFEHSIDAPAKAIGLGIALGVRFLDRAYAEAGFEGMFVTDKSYEKRLRPTGPGGFSDGSRDSLESAGDLPDARSFLSAIRASLGVEFPLSKRLFASPQINAALPLAGLTPYWSFASIGGGLRLRYLLSPPEQREEYADTIRIPVIVERPLPKPKLQAAISAIGVARSGAEEEVIRLDVEEVKARIAYPMLNYIFFDEGSAQIPARYQQFASPEEARARFKGMTNRTSQKLLEIYWESLNILGARLAANPTARMTLTGSTSNTGRERNALDLAKARAETIKNYLARIWSIAPDRIRTQARLLPEKPSPSTVAQGEEENRRVEITSTDERITDPIIVTNIEHLGTPSEIKLRTRINAEAGIRRSVATIGIAGTELVRFEGNVARQKAWTITEEALSAPVDSLDLALEVTDSAGNTVIARGSIPLMRQRAERERPEALERFSLILFGFDEDALGKKNERIIRFVGETFNRLAPERVTIFGYTDELGDPLHNDDLSRRRAESAARELERALRELGASLPPKTTLIEGKGSRERLYDNSLPEGRFFSRTVNITVENRE